MDKNIIEQYKQMKIGVDEPFKFHCTQCGECCINREDILLSANDLFRIAQKLECQPIDIISRYCDTYIGNDSRLPVVRLQPEGTQMRCPLLDGSKCSVHDAKPIICAMFPIGRCVQVSKEDLTPDFSSIKTEYIFVDPKCGDDSKTHTVREWLGDFGIPLDDPFFREWTCTIIELSTIFREVEKHLSENRMVSLWNAAFITLYCKYDMGKPFFPQFQKNRTEFLELMRQFPIDDVSQAG